MDFQWKSSGDCPKISSIWYPLWTNLTSAVNTNGVIFSWDVRKGAVNLKKHGIDFRETATIFADPLSTTFPGQDHSENEQRFLTIGESIRGRK